MTENSQPAVRRAGALRLGIIGVLSVAHELPVALLNVLTPTIFTQKLGLPIEQLWVFSIPVAITAFKWLWAPLVDAHGSETFGRRRSWIVPASLTVSLFYLGIALVRPGLDTLPLIITLFVLVKIVFSTQEIAADAYIVEAVGPKQRGTGSSAVWFGKEVGQIMGLAGTLTIADRFGWSAAFVTVAIVYAVLNSVVLLKPEVPQSEEGQRARARGQRASISHYVKHAVNRRVLLLTLFFSFSVQMVPAIIGPFLASKGLTLSEVGLVIGIAASAGAGISLAAASMVISRLGPKRTSIYLILIGLLAVPLFLIVALSDSPSLPLVAATIFTGSLCTAPVRMAFYAARMGWTSTSQVGTDFTTQQSMWFLGYALSIGFSGWLAATVGWTGLFIVNAVLTVSVMVVFIRSFDGIEAEVARLNAKDSAVDIPAS